MNTPRSGPAADALEVEVRLEALDLAAERVAPGADVHHAEVLAVEHDQPGAGAQHGQPSRASSRSGSAAPRAHPEHHRRGLATGDHETLQAVEVAASPHLAHPGAEPPQNPLVRLEVALQREHADQRLATARRGRAPDEPRSGHSRRHPRSRPPLGAALREKLLVLEL